MAIHDNIRLLSQRFWGLTRRERILLLAVAAALLVAVFFIIHLQIERKAQTIQRKITDKIQRLEQIEKLTGNYYLGQKRREYFENKLEKTIPGLTSHVEQAAAQANIEISSITPRADASIDENILERSVELTLTDVSLENLVAFLKACEIGPGIVFVKQLRMEPRPQNVLTCWITVATYSKKT
ncbi:MAG: type II secretion system protein GspM [Cystobacterineae bacterium]|nr:type II secretion system protein GspM [Cystobacterineae bacterium]